MLRSLRIYLLVCIALAFGYLVLHAGEPLRLNVGDAWTDADVLTSIANGSRQGIPELIYGAVGTLVRAHQLTVFRLLALVFSGVGAWLLFQYARRMWNDTVAIIATALTTTCTVWMLFADSIHLPPIVHCACFLALWGTVRVIETGRLRHYIAAFAGTFVCVLAASHDWLFLSLGVLFTVHVKRGNLLARGTWHVIAVCAAGGLLAMVVRSPFVADPSLWQSALDHRVAATFATLVRRYTVMFTPLLWLTLAWAVWRAVRAPTVKAAFEDGTTWMLVAALAFVWLPPQPESATLRTQLMLPFYALGSALLIARLLGNGRWLVRTFALAVCVVTPLWGAWLVVSHSREVLDRDDLVRANDYLARNDGNGFVMSNLLANGPIVAAFGRHGWTALPDPDPSSARLKMLELFEIAGTDYVHAVIFTSPGSRFVDRSIRQVVRHRMASVDGWPYLVRAKLHTLVDAYDRNVLRSLEAVGAKRVLEAGNFDIYRIDRARIIESSAWSLPVVRTIDFDSLQAVRHQLLGWGVPVDPNETRATLSSIVGYGRCRNPIAASVTPAPNGCTVVETPKGLDVLDVGSINRAELVVRVERACDQQLTITLAAPASVDVAFNGIVVLSCEDPQWGMASATVRVPHDQVRSGLNIISFDDKQADRKRIRPEVKSVVIEPLCESR